jgi:peptidoglycan/xylan/chitin deacetylase (PgdA/CDA1 family)
LTEKRGSLTISLDFELYWGMRDIVTLEAYGEHLLGVWEAVPRMLDLFETYGIHATWATVGFLWHEDFASLQKAFPERLPEYEDEALSPYAYLDRSRRLQSRNHTGSGESDGAEASDSREENDGEEKMFNQMHFAKGLIEKIKATPHQEIATHTYSHYYTREPRIVPEAFASDLAQACKVAAEDGVQLHSLVFPRNQIDRSSLEAVKNAGLKVYRGNPDHWAYREGETDKTLLQRLYRFADIYVNLSGTHTTLPQKREEGLMETKSSMFLRPYSKKFTPLEVLKRRRLTQAMTEAAEKGENFHLWWHPHNFGVNLEENMANLAYILDHYRELNEKYGMLSLTMQELGEAYV